MMSNPKNKKGLDKSPNNSFLDSYNLLNKEQKKAVDLIEGPVMVVAGPGTGKTQILTLRIANILKKADINPENVLALTFTENAASSMKKRLASIIGPEAYSVSISTFHSFANELILSNQDIFVSLLGSKPASDADRINIIRKGLKDLKLKDLRPLGNPDHYVKEILSAIESLKREGILPPEFIEIISKEEKTFYLKDDLYHEKGAHQGKMRGDYQKEEKSILKNKELSQIYEYYISAMRDSRLYDYSDMILEVLSALQTNESFLQSLQEKYQYILVDEHQDTNRAQNKIIELICSFDDKPNLFIVGDEKQAIYRFQGASLENFEYFKDKFPSAKIIILTDNYRSHQGILDSAHSILAGKKELKSALSKKNKKIDVVECENIEAENYYIATKIKEDIENGVKPEEIAILFHDNKDSLLIVQALAKMGIPFSLESDRDILDDREISKLVTLLKYLVNSGEDSLLAQVLHIDFLGIPPMDAYKIILEGHRSRSGLIDLLRSKESIQKLNLSSGLKAHDLFSQLMTWSSAGFNDYLLESLDKISNESGFITKILSVKDSFEVLEKFRKLFDEARMMADHNPQSTLTDFIDFIDLAKENKISIKKRGGPRIGKVRCMTAHSAKGLEFENVYIVGCYDTHWGNRKRVSLIKLPSAIYLLSDKVTSNDNDDERRLFYVAMTRAKNHLTITYPKYGLDGRELLASQFVLEIRPELVNNEYFKIKDVKYSLVDNNDNHSEDLKNLVREMFIQQGLSVTALNNYLNCPWQYFYNNLIRIPSPLEDHLMFGTAVHAALDDILKNNKRDKAFLLERFRYHLENQPMARKNLWRWQDKGEKILSSYFDYQVKNWKENSISEFNVKDIFITEDIKLNGKIDKVEILNDKNEINVVDYKTGTPKSRNEIEGGTKNSNGDIKRQLVFYKILLDRYKDGKMYKVVSSEVDFIEPEPSGKHKIEVFSVDDSQVKELIEVIKEVANEILNFSFENKYCSDVDCQYCALRKMTV